MSVDKIFRRKEFQRFSWGHVVRAGKTRGATLGLGLCPAPFFSFLDSHQSFGFVFLFLLRENRWTHNEKQDKWKKINKIESTVKLSKR